MNLHLQKLNIEEGDSQTFSFEESSFQDMGDVTLLEPVTGDFTISNVGAGYQLNGSFHAHISQPCVRCLEPVEDVIDFSVSELYLLSGEETDQEDVFVLPSDLLDVTDVVRQNLMMEVNEFPLCNNDCKGLCPICGANLNKTTCEHQRPGSKEE